MNPLPTLLDFHKDGSLPGRIGYGTKKAAGNLGSQRKQQAGNPAQNPERPRIDQDASDGESQGYAGHSGDDPKNLPFGKSRGGIGVLDEVE
jgi:hypothetical protein